MTQTKGDNFGTHSLPRAGGAIWRKRDRLKIKIAIFRHSFFPSDFWSIFAHFCRLQRRRRRRWCKNELITDVWKSNHVTRRFERGGNSVKKYSA